MAYHHGRGYTMHDECELIACADIVSENATAFADEFGLETAATYTDYEEMLETIEPDIVSVCVPPAIYAPIVLDCIQSGVVEAIHCEKPINTYGSATEMTEAAMEHDIQLTFNHQRRFSDAVRTAKGMLDTGKIGTLERIEFSAPVDIFDYGSHSFDLCNYFNDEAPGAWVMGQVDYSEENIQFGAHNENQAIIHWEYENGVHGLAGTGTTGTGGPAAGFACHNRLVGTDGVIEVGPEGGEAEELPALRVRRDGGDWSTIETEDGLHGWEFINRAIAENVRCLRKGEQPELRAENALKATELIFATWESSRRRGRVDPPLDINDNPLDAMVEAGDLTPTSLGER